MYVCMYVHVCICFFLLLRNWQAEISQFLSTGNSLTVVSQGRRWSLAQHLDRLRRSLGVVALPV